LNTGDRATPDTAPFPVNPKVSQTKLRLQTGDHAVTVTALFPLNPKVDQIASL
jgi:hypothetical protein